MNKVILYGRLTREPELRSNQGGSKVCKFSVAVNRSYKQNGEKQEETDFFDCDAWGKTGEAIAQYLHKGNPILIEGEIRNNNWTDNSGAKHYGTRINVTSFTFCGGNNQNQQGQQQSCQPNAQPNYQQPYPQNQNCQPPVPQGYPQPYPQSPQGYMPYPDYPPM